MRRARPSPKPDRPRSPWTPEERARITRLRSRGRPAGQAADKGLLDEIEGRLLLAVANRVLRNDWEHEHPEEKPVSSKQ